MSDILNEPPLYHRGPYQPDWFEKVDAAGGIAVSSDLSLIHISEPTRPY